MKYTENSYLLGGVPDREKEKNILNTKLNTTWKQVSAAIALGSQVDIVTLSVWWGKKAKSISWGASIYRLLATYTN